ncbi:hypothetical protein HDV05_008731 [Chytridiales sp. JEL 0842]|nr:hypothetical protein HDV05_008731 [Chytridiales sp. JEL 0842]
MGDRSSSSDTLHSHRSLRKLATIAGAHAASSQHHMNMTGSQSQYDLSRSQTINGTGGKVISRRASMIMKHSPSSQEEMDHYDHADDVTVMQHNASFGMNYPNTTFTSAAGSEDSGYQHPDGSDIMSEDPSSMSFFPSSAANGVLDEESNENMIKLLVESDTGFTLLLDRIKENMHSCKDAANFLKRRAAIEEEYAKAMIKLVQTSASTKSASKEGTYSSSWSHFLQIHDQVAQSRLKLSADIQTCAEDLNTLHKNTERSRKQLKDAGLKHWKQVHEAENALEKAKGRYETLMDEWERALNNKDNAEVNGLEGVDMYNANPALSMAVGSMKIKGGVANIAKNFNLNLPSGVQGWVNGNNLPAKLHKIEEEMRVKASAANDAYKHQLQATNAIRAAYYQRHLPRFIRMLKETNDTCDIALQNYLVQHAHCLEESLMREATTISPVEPEMAGHGAAQVLQRIQNAEDFEQYVDSYMQSKEGSNQLTSHPMLASEKPYFGIDLITLSERDSTPVPVVVRKLVETIERFGGLRLGAGLYKLQSSESEVQMLRGLFEREGDTLDLTPFAPNLALLSSTLKLYLRELPDSLLPTSLYKPLMETARIEDERLRLISVHELVNGLHDAHYASLQTILGHLWRLCGADHQDPRPFIQGVSIVWAPIIMDSADTSSSTDAAWELKGRCRVIETLLMHFEKIFDVGGEEAGEGVVEEMVTEM